MTQMRIRCAWLLLAVLGTAAAASERPNLLFISLDTARADHLPMYGYARDTAPAMDALAREGVLFERAYAPTASTAPSHATMFTGLYPLSHGLRTNGQEFSDDARTLAEFASEAGYVTGGVASSYVIAAEMGFAQGFATFRDQFTIEGSKTRFTYWGGRILEHGFDQRANKTTDRAIEWMDAYDRPSGPFLLFIHYFEPHAPYLPPEPYASQYPVAEDAPAIQKTTALYDAGLRFTDDQVGRLLGEMRGRGLLENTLIVLVADHGEALGEHGIVGHGRDVYEETMRVPFVIVYPGVIPGGRRIHEPVALADLLPTLAGLMQFPAPPGLQGIDLRPALLENAPLDPDRPIYLHRQYHLDPPTKAWGKGEHFGILYQDWKYIVGKGDNLEQLFDLTTDPLEQSNVLETQPERAATLAAMLNQFLERSGQMDSKIQPIPEEHEEGLRALGYIK